MGIHLAIEHALELEAAHAAFEAYGLALDVRRGALVVFALGELQKLGRIRDGFGGAVELLELGCEFGALAPELLRFVGLLPDGRVFELAIDLL
jgi:hypothetical protein